MRASFVCVIAVAVLGMPAFAGTVYSFQTVTAVSSGGVGETVSNSAAVDSRL